jgi:hypothetical protein
MLRSIVLSLVALLTLACGSGPIIIQGRVVDHRGMPVSKAEVVTEPQTDLVVSNSRGFFVLRQRINDLGETELIAAGVYRIHVRKFGFEDLSFDVKAEGGPMKVADIILQPRTPDIGEAAPDTTEEQERGSGEGSIPNQGI